MKTSTLMAYIASVSISASLAVTFNMQWWCAFLLSMGLMAVLSNVMDK